MSLRKQLVFAGRHFTPTWRYLFNLRSTLAYRIEKRSTSSEINSIVEAINREGIAITSHDRLRGLGACFNELKETVAKLETTQADQIAVARSQSENALIGRKTFILKLLGENPALDPQCIFARLALEPAILEIANSYFGMYTQIRYYNVWHTLVTEGAPRESQLWHFDREDHLILKLFVYLSDVDEGAGPFTYAPGTHRKGANRMMPESFDEAGVPRWTDEEMDRIVPASKWIRATGKTGTFVFADTRGFHKGGLARERDRLIYVCLFTSPTSQAPELFVRPEMIPALELEAQRRALALPAKGIFA